ncbi:MAG: M23 family metallopeptidase [Desulfovibrionaceae bacterium]|nr:M23 family metallopeptidase [Desulfovibrionaceae bacterium]
MIAKPWKRFARASGLIGLALALTACVARQPSVPAPSREARLVRDVMEDFKAEAVVNRPALAGSGVPPGRLVALSSARVAAFSPARAPLITEAGAGWFMEPSLHNVEECPHCQEEGSVRISSEYGKRRDPKRRGRYRTHHGVDIRAPKGSPVLAFKGGTVIRASFFSGYGRTVEIRQYDGMVARYAHLNTILVTEGEDVSAGTRVGEVGRTGRTTGAHLHFELLKDGKSHDPMQFLTRAEQVVRCLVLESALESARE